MTEDINDVIAEIRETSAKAEHGPWRAQPCEPDARYSDIKGDLDLGWWAHIARGVKNENAAHIAACCPANMAAVIAHIDTLTRARNEARADHTALQTALVGNTGLSAILEAGETAALRAEVERLKREREEARRDTREVSMFARHVAKAGPDAVEAMRARCERIAEEIGDDITDDEGLSPLDVSMAIKGAIASLKVEGAPDPRDADIVAVRGRTWTLIANEELDAMRAEIAALREALKPFAAMADHYRHREAGESILSATPFRGVWVHILAGDLFRAAALAKGGAK